MIFYLHYILLTSAHSGILALMGLFFKNYTDASDLEIGLLVTSFPFAAILLKPLICSLADSHQAHQLYLILSLTVMLLGFAPFMIIPFFPSFYLKPRLAWYLLLVSCEIGQGGQNVAWSLGDSLAVNMAKKKGTPFGYLRAYGAICSCMFGLAVGKIGDLSYLPRLTPAFIIILLLCLIEIVLLAFWNKEDFYMVESNIESDLTSPQNPPQKLESSSKQNTVLEAVPSGVVKIEVCATKKKHTAMLKSRMQLILLKMIFDTDARLIKYLVLFTVLGVIISPVGFIGLSLDGLCSIKGCSATQMAGFIQASHAISETVSFFLSAWLALRVSKSNLLAFCLILLGARYLFYAGYYYTPDVSPYWVLVSESAHGFTYALIATISASLALMFAERSEFFIPDLRKRGLMSTPNAKNALEILNEEHHIKMILRASMQGIFGGCLDGIGRGVGGLICSSTIEFLSYLELWQILALVTFTTLFIHQVVELIRLKWSDSYDVSAVGQSRIANQFTR